MQPPDTLVGTGTPDFVVQPAGHQRKRVMLVGPGFRFLSGLSVYSCRLANALADGHDVSVVLLDRLIPARLYPGWRRVGADLTSLRYDPRVREVATVDWYWGTSIGRIRRALALERPDVIVLQWWTAATLHTYLALARLANRAGIPIVIEFHEVQDPGEAQVPLAAAYCRRYLHRLVRRSAGAIFHTDHDADLFASMFGADAISRLHTVIAPHGPYDHVTQDSRRPSQEPTDGIAPTQLLCFGLIRPYKGVEDLIHAFDAMTPEQAERFEIDVVGETWERCTAPAEAISASRYRDRIRFDNRYVTDAEAAAYFANADVLVLPYRRGSASGPLQIAMNNGIFVVMYAVGGLVDAVRDYHGAVLVPPGDVEALRAALLSICDRRGERFEDPHTWTPLIDAIDALIAVPR
jgi:glycosyltransferase involved in cell wall biosynthesis